jgi:hypothetical protein
MQVQETMTMHSFVMPNDLMSMTCHLRKYVALDVENTVTNEYAVGFLDLNDCCSLPEVTKEENLTP